MLLSVIILHGIILQLSIVGNAEERANQIGITAHTVALNYAKK